MELDVSIEKDAISIHIDNPFRLDLNSIVKEIEDFAVSKGSRLKGLDIKGVISKMVRGIAGCESGCPSNALELVNRGVKNFKISYIEGGILTAKAMTEDEKTITLKMFPEF
jgi:hypothetical protein